MIFVVTDHLWGQLGLECWSSREAAVVEIKVDCAAEGLQRKCGDNELDKGDDHQGLHPKRPVQ